MRPRLLFSPLWTLALVTACSFHASCGGGLDMRKLERFISTHLESLGLQAQSVSCPDDKKSAKKGDKFTCTATMPDGFTIPVAVEVQGGDGNVYVEPAGRVVVVEAVVDKIRSTLADKGLEATVDCGTAKLLPSRPDAVYQCQVTASNGSTGTAKVTVDNDQGSVSFVIVED